MAYFRCTTGGSGKGNTLVVTCADDLAGATITCTNGTKTYTKTCPSTSPYEVTFYGLEAGTWTVSATVSGNTYTTTVVVADIEALLGGFNWRTWVDTAQFLDSSDYNSLDEVLADEEAVRELCLEHNCVDYLADITTASEDVETIINNDLFAKWVNNSDYSLDILGANTTIKALMDEADKYFYGEWTLQPQVPTMTSNTAPYGEASASSTWQNVSAYYAFDGDNSRSFGTASGNTTGYVQYKFVNPTNVRKVRITNRAKNNYKDFRIQASNDNSNWTTLYTGTNPSNNENYVNEIAIANDEFFLYYRLQIDTAYQNDGSYVYVGCKKLQFYAWAPKGNVPVMTSDTAPYGTVVYSTASTDANLPVWKLFDGNDSTYGKVEVNDTRDVRIGYNFSSPCNIKMVMFRPLNQGNHPSRITKFKVQYSDDNVTFTDATDWIDGTGAIEYNIDVEPVGYHSYWYIYFYRSINAQYPYAIATIQFYGRELSVSVPKMATNTTPYGEASASSEISSYGAYQAFSSDSTHGWVPVGGQYTTSDYLRYQFVSPMMAKKAHVLFIPVQTRSFKYKIQGSNTANSNDWTDVSEEIQLTAPSGGTYDANISLTSSQEYLYYQFVPTTSDTLTDAYGLKLQFYGLDYSEKEFEEGTNKKWLYDHGVELETLTASGYSISGVTLREAIKEPSQIYFDTFSSDGTGFTFMGTANAIDLTDYSYLMIRSGNKGKARSNNADFIGGLNVKSTKSAGADGYINIKDMYYVNALDVSSFNQSKFATISSGAYNSYYTITELWLE